LAIGEAVVSLAVEVSNLVLELSSSEKPTEGYHVTENQQKLEHVTRPYVQPEWIANGANMANGLRAQKHATEDFKLGSGMLFRTR
jgi:hypothetical protein